MEIDQIIKLAQSKLLDGNLLEAEQLFLKAAELGSGHAAHELGVLYIIGGEGLEPNYEKSQFWLEKSLALGFEETIATDPKWFRKKPKS